MRERASIFENLAVALLVVFAAALLPISTGAEGLQGEDGWWPAVSAEVPREDGPGKIAPKVETSLASLEEDEMLTVVVTLVEQADLSQIPGASRAARLHGVIRALQALAEASQKQIEAFLTVGAAQGLVSEFTTFWVFNGLSVTATPGVIEELAARDDVATITPNDLDVVPLQGTGLPEQNLSVVGAPALWELGLQGQGVVVASMDTGVSGSHADLVDRWRGGTNSWFDPYGEHPTSPVDLMGHGTATMGVMVGGSAGGTAIGVAPGAEWIAVKIYNDAGGATASAIHAGFQWLLDPDGDPVTPDAPYVVNNSWMIGNTSCDLSFEFDLQSLRAAGILPVFAAGNGGPSAGTSYSPANNPSAFAVGATDDSDGIYPYSSRGPSSCGETEAIFPELVSPGVAIHTTDLYGLYTDATGTSLAAPHVAGGLALLLSAYPDLTAGQQEDALISSALDLGAAGPDNVFGYGRLDLLAAYEWLSGALPPTGTPMPTPDPTVNLALGKPVTVSSFQDLDHSGPAAVDGSLATYWMTEKAVGNKKLPSEWIRVDLGSEVSVGGVALAWADYYATNYSIELSADDATWNTVFATTAGDGGGDGATFGPYLARYLRMTSTAWSNDSRRSWLRELEVYSGGDATPVPDPTETPTSTSTPTAAPTASPTPLPTATPSPTSTPLPSPTPTPGSTTTMHVSDLDGSSSLASGRWDATVIVEVVDGGGAPAPEATVAGVWSGGGSGAGTCVTDTGGTCEISLVGIKKNFPSVVFTVENVSHTAMTYAPSANIDPDGDSDGTTITVAQP